MAKQSGTRDLGPRVPESCLVPNTVVLWTCGGIYSPDSFKCSSQKINKNNYLKQCSMFLNHLKGWLSSKQFASTIMSSDCITKPLSLFWWLRPFWLHPDNILVTLLIALWMKSLIMWVYNPKYLPIISHYLINFGKKCAWNNFLIYRYLLLFLLIIRFVLWIKLI